MTIGECQVHAIEQKREIMALPHKLLSTLLTLILLSPSSVSAHLKTLKLADSKDTSPLPSNFLFGTASSAYQYEGAYSSDGKGLSNWDTFTHSFSKKIKDKSNGDVATDHYHRYQEDIDLMADLGVNSYRFSISWARILPKGRCGNVNLAGISFYNKLIDALLIKGIQPFVTLSHFDIPEELEDRYGAWLNPRMKEEFAYYADICFKYFGDRVKYWATFNEPNVVVIFGYRIGTYPPCRCSGIFGNCTAGDSKKEPFVAAHNIILAHAVSVDLYRRKYQKQQGGLIGIVMHALWYEPISNSLADRLAVERAQSFFLTWFLDPIMFGKYPADMEMILGLNLPKFSRMERKILNNALDFIGINHYTSFYVKDCMFSKCQPGSGVTWTEGLYQKTSYKGGIPIGEPTAMKWLYIYPQGMKNIISYVKDRYNNTPLFITENGYAQESDNNSSTNNLLNDSKRAEYMESYLDMVLKTIRRGADVRGYFAWSLLDNFEWLEGYTKRFGLYHVDYTTLKRSPKLSVTWYKQFIAKHKSTEALVAEKK